MRSFNCFLLRSLHLSQDLSYNSLYWPFFSAKDRQTLALKIYTASIKIHIWFGGVLKMRHSCMVNVSWAFLSYSIATETFPLQIGSETGREIVSLDPFEVVQNLTLRSAMNGRAFSNRKSHKYVAHRFLQPQVVRMYQPFGHQQRQSKWHAAAGPCVPQTRKMTIVLGKAPGLASEQFQA